MILLSEFIDVFHGSGVLLEYVGKLLRLDGDRSSHELRDVVTLEQLTMLVGIIARQFEGFGAATVVIDMGDEGTSVVGVVSATAEHDPFAVARPGVITLRVRRVDFLYVPNLSRLQIQHPEVGIVVPDVEDAILGKGEHQESAIGRDAWQRGTLVEGIG